MPGKHTDINIDAYIPNFGQYVHERPGFIFNPELNQYECQRGHRAFLERNCKNCPLREQCSGKSTKFKKIDDSIYKSLYAVTHDKMQTPYVKRISRIRSKTVEPVLGTLINFLNIKNVNTRGIKQTNKHVIMAALCYTLKKYLNFKKLQPKINCQILQIQLNKSIKSTITLLFEFHRFHRLLQYEFSISRNYNMAP